MTETVAVGASALSCLTANLSTYLSSTMDDPLGHIARSVHLGVRFGVAPAFSHHRYSIATLGPGRQLAYRATTDPVTAVARLAEQIDSHGGVLVLTYSGALPWSLARPDDAAPHLVLLTDHADQWWHASDAFSALLPGGRQNPFDGRIGTTELLHAMHAPTLAIEQRHRIRYAFGPAAAVPSDDGYRWLEPAPAETHAADPDWTDDPDVVLPRLGSFFAGLPAGEEFIDDIWAAAQHHAFRYAHLLQHHALTGCQTAAVDAAVTAWNGLPMSLHFAADSARRGRPRATLVTTSFLTLHETELRCVPILVQLGYAAPRDRVIMKGRQ